MKTLLTFLFLSVSLLLAGVAVGQINHAHNEVGIYAVPDPDGCASAQIDAAAWAHVTCYIVVTNPYSESRGRPITTMGGFECRYVVPDDVYVLNGTYPPGAFPPCFPEPGELLFGCNVPVVDDHCVLFTLTLASTTGGPGFIYLTPVQAAPQSIPGHIAITDYDDAYALQAVEPVSGSFDVPVFAINWDGELSFCETVPDEGIAFGAVKALYR